MENIRLYTDKYDEEFEPHLRPFAQDVWGLLMKVSTLTLPARLNRIGWDRIGLAAPPQREKYPVLYYGRIEVGAEAKVYRCGIDESSVDLGDRAFNGEA